jgi:hypothetical protein
MSFGTEDHIASYPETEERTDIVGRKTFKLID